jgi:hypothetical protein
MVIINLPKVSRAEKGCFQTDPAASKSSGGIYMEDEKKKYRGNGNIT